MIRGDFKVSLGQYINVKNAYSSNNSFKLHETKTKAEANVEDSNTVQY